MNKPDPRIPQYLAAVRTLCHGEQPHDRIVEAHGGEAWAESGVGQGSTFRFTLPLAAAP